MNIRKYAQYGVVFGALMFLFACDEEVTTIGYGNLQNADGFNSQRVIFQIVEDGGNAQASVMLAGGEVFTGTLVISSQQTTEHGTEMDLSGKDDDVLLFRDTTTYGSAADGLLLSNRRSMRCEFTLRNPSSGFSGGGVGQCRISTGEMLPVQF